jgi:two-component system alkaline phosphatase synthesis response regulator PhoP
MMELVSRVNALLRRGSTSQRRDDKLCNGPVLLSTARREVTVNGDAAALTYKEFELLRFLMENAGLVFTRNHLLESIWGWDFGGNTRTVDVHVQTLRQKLGEGAGIIETVRGVGYRVRSAAD